MDHNGMKTSAKKLFIGATAFLLASIAFADMSSQQRVAAVEAAVTQLDDCKKLGDFYWEIGDKDGIEGSGVVGKKFTAQRIIPIASASKWVFGSYVLEKIGSQREPSPEQIQALEMRSGYTNMKLGHCAFQHTTAECFNGRGSNEFNPAHVGKFFYNNGHDQKLAIDMGLGDLSAQQFGEEVRKYIGADLDIDFNTPQPAGGMKASPGDYGKFLRKILNGDLRMRDYLGFQPVCTLPKKCAESIYSPVAAEWHYSLNHWIEDGDGAFSSAGLFGFYPWISVDKQWYGIIARVDRRLDASKESIVCGVQLRRAWVTAARN